VLYRVSVMLTVAFFIAMICVIMLNVVMLSVLQSVVEAECSMEYGLC
jgi:TRAP-type C4-dicarboxylate transport system permease small subunit